MALWVGFAGRRQAIIRHIIVIWRWFRWLWAGLTIGEGQVPVGLLGGFGLGLLGEGKL